MISSVSISNLPDPKIYVPTVIFFLSELRKWNKWQLHYSIIDNRGYALDDDRIMRIQ